MSVSPGTVDRYSITVASVHVSRFSEESEIGVLQTEIIQLLLMKISKPQTPWSKKMSWQIHYHQQIMSEGLWYQAAPTGARGD